MNKRHDAGYKLLFSTPEVVRDLIIGFIPDTWLQSLDYTTLERVSGSYITDDLRERCDDIVWRVRVDGDWVYLYLLIEFQSTIDPWMAVRMLVYIGLLYQDLIRQDNTLCGKKLPPVLPIVLYNGNGRWTAARNIAQLIPPLPGRLGQYLPQLKYLLIDENAYTPSQLAKLHNLAAIIMRAERPNNQKDILDLVDLLSEMLQDKPEIRQTFTIWLRALFQRRTHRSLGFSTSPNLKEFKMKLAERMDQWEAQAKLKGHREGHQEGHREGHQEGHQKGLIEGETLLLQRLLTRRFGILPADITARIAAASAADIEQWSDRLLDANHLDEIFGH